MPRDGNANIVAAAAGGDLAALKAALLKLEISDDDDEEPADLPAAAAEYRIPGRGTAHLRSRQGSRGSDGSSDAPPQPPATRIEQKPRRASVDDSTFLTGIAFEDPEDAESDSSSDGGDLQKMLGI